MLHLLILILNTMDSEEGKATYAQTITVRSLYTIKKILNLLK